MTSDTDKASSFRDVLDGIALEALGSERWKECVMRMRVMLPAARSSRRSAVASAPSMKAPSAGDGNG